MPSGAIISALSIRTRHFILMPTTPTQRLSRFLQSLPARREGAFPWLLLAVGFAAYGLLIPWLGLYWDDWPKALFLESIGPQAFSQFAAHRPLNGKWYVLFTSLLGARPLGWQLFALFWRWASALAFWAFLKKLWPRRANLAAWAALLFLLYPGFTQQNIALSYYIHFLANTTFLLSFFLTAWALRDPPRSRLFHFIALTLSALTMLTTDYFYGLELVRPLVIFLILRSQSPSPPDAARNTAKTWLPYLLIVLALFAWRATLSAPEAYQVTLFENLLGPAPPLAGSLGAMLTDLWEGGLLAWLAPLTNLTQLNLQSRVALLALILALLLAALLWAFFARPRPTEPDAPPSPSSIWELPLFALAALILANIPAWASGLEPSLHFPADRLNLPMAAGASLLILALITLILRDHRLHLPVIALLLALSVTLHLNLANQYREDFDSFSAFWGQFTWRAPSLAPHTAILSEELPLSFFTDDSFTGAINLIYPSPNPEQELNNALFYLDLRLGSKVPSLAPDEPIYWNYRLIDFEGSTSQSLVIYHAPPACLRVLHPVYDQGYPLLPAALRSALPLSNPALIAPDGIPAALPTHLIPQGSPDSWCYYFQQADLARQQGDWAQVVQLGDQAFQLSDSPNHASERLPFIEAYARIGDWARALELSRESLRINQFMGEMLCAAWGRLALEAEPSPAKDQALKDVVDEMGCGIPLPPD